MKTIRQYIVTLLATLFWAVLSISNICNAIYAEGANNPLLDQLREALDNPNINAPHPHHKGTEGVSFWKDSEGVSSSKGTERFSSSEEGAVPVVLHEDSDLGIENKQLLSANISSSSQPEAALPQLNVNQSPEQQPKQSDQGLVTNVPSDSGPQPTVMENNKETLQDILKQYQISPIVRAAAFESLKNQYMPLTPAQIVALRKLFNISQLAANTAPYTPPKPMASSMLVNLSPGSQPPNIRLASGYVTSLLFLDSSGAPWPIASYDLGNPRVFNVQWDKKGNTLMIQGTSLYTAANMQVILQGLNTPVTLNLVPGQKVVDYRVDLRIPGLGPLAQPLPLGNSLPATENSELLNILDGVPPSSGKRLDVSGVSGQAWLIDGHLFLRTRVMVISPSWISTLSSADGMHAYELMPTPHVLATQHGQLVHLKIEGY